MMNTIFKTAVLAFVFGFASLGSQNYDPRPSFEVAYQRIEDAASCRITKQLNLRYSKPPQSARSKIDRFINDYPYLAKTMFLEDVLYSAPFELFERYYLNDIYLGTLFNTVHLSMRPSKKQYLHFSIPLDPWEPSLNRFFSRSTDYIVFPFAWTFRWMRKAPANNTP